MTTEQALQICNIQYEDKGNRYVACCPFHPEKTPSFSIYKNSGFWKCFGCGKKGSLSDLLFELTGEKVEFKQPYIIHERNNLKKDLRLIDYTVDGEFLDIFENKRVLEYCWSIGFTNEFIEYFKIKYFKKVAFIYDKTKEPKYYYNRIVIPCLLNNKIYNYECRDFTRKSSAKVLYPSQAENDFLFNFDNINKNEEVVVVEGIKGLAKVWSYYSHNVVSTFGKMLKPNQKKQLLLCKNITRLPDNDENKIDSKTGLPRDNVMSAIEEMDSFYPDEYSIAYIPYKGFDPNNLTLGQMREVMNEKKKSIDVLMERSGVFKNKNIDYLSTLTI